MCCWVGKTWVEKDPVNPFLLILWGFQWVCQGKWILCMGNT